MATQRRPPASRMSVGGNILSRMLQLEKQSKQHRNSAPNLLHDGNSNPPTMSPLKAAASSPASAPAARPTPQKARTAVSPAAVRQSQSVPPGPASHAATSSNQRPESPRKPAPQPAQEVSSQRPSTMPRAQTLPALSIDVIASQTNTPSKASKPEPEADEESVMSEICQSPSWSDFGGAKRKKEKKRFEKERKEEEKKLKKEEAKQKAADLKAGKRLSKKPPPAAMETQKMSSALRRNSIVSFVSSHSSSGDTSRSHSRDGKRLSIVSTDSSNGNHCSRSTLGTSTELRPNSSEGSKSVVSPVAPQLPRLSRLGWHSRSGSSGTDKSRSWGSDDQYEKELVNFAYQFHASANPSSPKDIVLGNVKVNQVSVQHPPKRQSGAWPITRSQTDPELAKTNGTPKVADMEQRPPVGNRQSSGDNTGASAPMGNHGSHLNSNDTRPKSRDPLNDIHNNGGRPEDDKIGRMPAAKVVDRRGVTNTAAPQGKPGFDGNSYVHKQRMHQQQLSIASFEDEQAVRIANEMHVEEEESSPEEAPEAAEDNKMTEEAGAPPPRQQEPPRPQLEKPQQIPPLETRVKPQEPSGAERASQDIQWVKESHKSPAVAPSSPSRKSPAVTPPSPSRNSTIDKLLGFKRRLKPEQAAFSLSGNVLTLDRKGPKVSPPPPKDKSSPPPVPSPKGKLDSAKAMKAIDSASKAQQKRISESVEIAERQEKMKEPKPSHSHSRTRTSSSQLLNEDLPMSRPLPRSSTAPVLSSEMKLPSALSDKSRNESPCKSERKSVTFERSVADALAETEKQNKAPAKASEIVIETVSPEGLVRTTSITRPRSNPNLLVAATNAPNLQLAASKPQLPSLDFLPQLKHQPLPKRDPNRASFMATPDRPASSQFPAPVSLALKPTLNPLTSRPLSTSSPNLANVPGAMVRPESYAGSTPHSQVSLHSSPNNVRRRTISPNAASSLTRTSVVGAPNVFGRTPTPSESVNAKPMAKLFVICCKCNYWHDLPSHLYEAMCTPKDLTRDPEGKDGHGPKVLEVKDGKKKVAEATLETMVKCPWCEHFMTTRCCAGWTAVLYLQERHH
ncbi:MAG: hypothetical protein Q9171_007364 [Xanthocarpia ochracea]